MHENDITAADLPVRCPVFHHVNLKTNQLDALIDWYATVVGTRVTFRRHDIAFITNDAANHRIAITANKPYVEPEGGRAAHVGLHHTAFEYRSLDELLQTWVRLERQDIVPEFCLDHGPTMSFYYRDPDDNFVELQADNWDNSLQSGQFMGQDPRFLEDPIGRRVDPQKLVEARHAGLTPWEVHLAAYRGELSLEVVGERTDRG